ncbi:Dkk4p [Phytophthora ramorum]
MRFPRVCSARSKSLVAVLWLLWLSLLRPAEGFTCPNYCSSRGLCLAQGLCSCPKGWSGPDCSIATCPLGSAWADGVIGTDNGHNLAPCSNRGECELDTGTCTCDSGFTGAACERMTCTCNGHGSCKSMASYALMKDPGRGAIYPYDNNWDARKIYGCVCDRGYTGANCMESDDPLTGTLLDPNGIQRNEKQRVNCKATSGSFTLTFAGYTTDPIFADDTAKTLRTKFMALPSVTAATVTFGGITLTACTTIGNDISIEFTQDFGDLPDIYGNPTGLAHSTPSVIPTLTFATITQGTKESLPCSRRGLCDRTAGVCSCYANYFSSDGTGGIGQRGDCGYVSGVVTACPGEIACSGQGTCRGPPTYDCICNQGFTGGDCNERLCPKGRSWFDRPIDTADTAHALVECSNAGECDRTKGDCICMSGFTGAACNRLLCPNDCSGHGTCYTMEQLAKKATLNGETMGWTYGAVPNKKETWDYDVMQGCLCSSGWEGHDCSQRSCPTGDDPMTLRQQNEVQMLVCTGNSGFFTLKFRDAATPQLPFNAPAASLAAALEALTTVGKVSVTYSTDTNLVSGSPACNAAGSNTMRIEFLTNFGDLPPLRWILDGALTLTISVDGVGGSVQGTKEEVVCANRGICNHLTGGCRCAYGFTSSDGFGGEGDRGDCGYMEPLYLTSAAQQANTV